MNIRRAALVPLLVAIAWAVACASSDAAGKREAPAKLKKPDHVQVRDFAVTAADVELDRGLGPGMRAIPGEVTSTAERKLGQAASNALASSLVAKLREYKIPAERARRAAAAGPKTLVIVGRFVTLDEGTTTRTRVGVGAGASEVRAEARAYMAGQLIAGADAVARSGKKPSAGAAGAGATAISEGLLTSVQADARRTGEELAKRIRDAYKRRGWL